jgi:hypothetical protein
MPAILVELLNESNDFKPSQNKVGSAARRILSINFAFSILVASLGNNFLLSSFRLYLRFLNYMEL